jgi:hypothetical protein
LKKVYLLQFEELKRKIAEVERKQLMEDKEYQITSQQLQAQLESAQEQRKNLDLVGIKKRLEDYEYMLQYYTLMKMKNKMKDYEAKFKEWWKVIEEYFTKELEKNLAEHRANEKIKKYKLEAYQKNFPNFICGSPTSTKVLGQYEETETGPSGTT